MAVVQSNHLADSRGESQATLREGAAFGPWRLHECIGRSEWMEVFSASYWEGDPSLAPYCVKRLRKVSRRVAAAVESLQTEAFALSQAQHPNLLALLESQIDSPPFWIATPKLQGATLRRFVGRNLNAPTTLWLVRQAAEALQALHSRRWRHGDVKPENLFVDANGHVTLIDLGFAAQFGASSWKEWRGSPLYAAPELSTPKMVIDGASDIFALGIVLFELLAGEPPFQAEDAGDLMLAIAQGSAPDLRDFRPNLSNRVTQLVGRMLAKQPLRRPAASELVETLAGLEIELFAQRAG